MQKYRFVVEVITAHDFPRMKPLIQSYVREAVEGWCGQFDPDDERQIVRTQVKDFERVLQAEMIKKGLRAKQVHLRIDHSVLPDVISKILHGTSYHRLMRIEHKAMVDRVIKTVIKGGS